MRSLVLVFLWSVLAVPAHSQSVSTSGKGDLVVRKTDDFSITGDGTSALWNKTEWIKLNKLDAAGRDYASNFKILYSSTGIYVLFRGDDDKITTEDFQDFDPIFKGDVFEVFFHPNPAVGVYYEYEVNALNKEFILAISNLNGKSHTGWMPSGKRGIGIKKAVSVEGGTPAVNATVKSWTAEIFFPYGALGILPEIPPKSGDSWHANFCRLDYDPGSMVKWSWSPGIKKSFHELDQFLSIRFE